MDPGTDVTKHVRRKRTQLAYEISSKKKIYLDTKYWALLRDVRLGKSSTTALVALLQRLEELVQCGAALCPLNADIFFEVFTQEDPATLAASVALMVELSGGVCLVPMTERFPMEVFHFLESNIHGGDGVYTLDELMWTKAAYIIGFVTPDCYLLDANANARIQKEFADYLWTLEMTDYLNTLGVDKAGKMFSFPNISRQLNDGKMGSLREHKSFKSLFLCEVQGILDVHKPEFASLILYKFERDTGQQLTDEDAANDKSGQLVANLILTRFD